MYTKACQNVVIHLVYISCIDLVQFLYTKCIQFLCGYQQNKSSESKVKFRQASNCSKWVLEAAKLAYATKTKESIPSQKLGSWEFHLANC